MMMMAAGDDVEYRRRRTKRRSSDRLIIGFSRRAFQIQGILTVLLMMLLTAAAARPSPLILSHASLPHHRNSHLTRLLHDKVSEALAAATSQMQANAYAGDFNEQVVARELVASSTPPTAAGNVAQTDYICADSC